MHKVVLFLVVVSWNSSYAQKGSKPAKKVDSVTNIRIMHLPLFMSTSSRISCEEFDSWDEMKDTINITSPDVQTKIIKGILEAKPYIDSFKKLDTRSKMFIFYESGRIDSLCLNPTILFTINGMPKLFSDRYVPEFIISLPNKNDPHQR